MTTTPPEEPQQPTPPPPGYTPPAGQTPPPAGYAPPPPGGYAPPPAYGAPAGAPMSDSDQRTWAMLAHLAGILSIIATIVIWAVYKEKGQFVKEQATEALNFQILVTIAYIVSWILATITAGILFFVPFLVGIAALVFMIIAGLAANKGEAYRYPVNWRIIK